MEDAKEAAEESYEALLNGDYDKFLSGRADMDSIADDYREQLLTSYKQFITQQRNAHNGINGITAKSARIDSTQHLIQVFLLVNYADSLQEEICVPMVERNGEWVMK